MSDTAPASPMPEIEWVDDLPERKHGNAGKYDALIVALKAQPGDWSRWPEQTGAAAGARAQYLRRKGLDAISRTVDGTPYVYARYVADES